MEERDIYRERLELALEAAGLDLWENDLVSGEVTCKVSKIFAELGYEAHEAVAYVDEIFGIIHPDDVPVLKAAVDDHLSGRTGQYRCEFRIRAKSGAWVWYANYGKIMDGDANRQGRRFIGVTFNIDDRKRKEDEIERMNQKLTEQNALLGEMNARLQALATTDSLTGVANRRKLMASGETELTRAQRFDHPLSLLIIDIDLFKKINDTWGHMAGDQVIQSVAMSCVKNTREHIDTVGRIGGEEFAILLPETDHVTASMLAERLREEIERSRIVIDRDPGISCTVSIGVSTSAPTRASETFRDLLIRADNALYAAKTQGRNRVHGAPAHVGAAPRDS
ncbi:MAG: sensor domain-containing diguanylate cyclase [Pseudomonadota bacterium]